VFLLSFAVPPKTYILWYQK